MDGRQKRRSRMHPTISAAIITSFAAIVTAVVTVVLTQSKAPDGAVETPRGTPASSSAKAAKLAGEYSSRKGEEYVQVLFRRGTWSLAAKGSWEGSMSGTYTQEGTSVKLIVNRSDRDLTKLGNLLTMNLDEYGILHLLGADDGPTWDLMPKGK